MAHASQRLGLDNLPELLASRKVLGDAWSRGRKLRQLQELAAGPICLKAVAERMGYAEAAFNAWLAADFEAADIFRIGRHEFFLRSKRAIMAGAEAGRAHCLRTLETIIRQESGASGPVEPIDFRRLSVTQMESATGIRRQQILRWHKAYDLPANPDGTYSMAAFIQWLRRNPQIGRARKYARKPGAVEKRIIARCAAIVREELNRGPDTDGQ
jgi:hypothetical protein